MFENIGSKIKKIRKSNGMTLKELSEKTNLSVGFLSQLERGLTTIAIDSLQLIAEALRVELSYFIAQPESKKRPVLKSFEQKIYKVMNCNFINYHLSNNLEDMDLLPRLIDILPMDVEEEVKEYSHNGEEFVYVLEGILTLILEGKEYRLYPGDSAHYSSHSTHNWANYTNRTVKIVVVSTPNNFKVDKGGDDGE
ncbi:helix-turn-helix domain-containing protein [Clostridiisalibacter paucivorans]|uniref:helix-turn-helix domain-containing protein n=1 Tax=Clostridiisalibacter paucivorans TaxID=408753 RepID=UPI00047EDC40|nr:XRE family transcriptional regulator [Clostridiisalibacter paucivorans]